MSLWVLVLISCVAMVGKDAVATFLTIAEARGRAHLSGVLNMLGTPTSVVFYSFGATRMVGGHYGVWGWLGLLPIMCVDYVDGRLFTTWGRRIASDLPVAAGPDAT